MTPNSKFSIGVDISLLQALDSYFNYVQGIYGTDKPSSLHYEIDIRCRRQFIRVVDLFIDSPSIYLVTPRDTLGWVGQLGKQVVDAAKLIVDATGQHPIESTDGEGYYKAFLKHYRTSVDFRKEATQWAWFQFLDLNALLGYSTRMGWEEDELFVKDEMKADFKEAFAAIDDDKRLEIVEKVVDQSFVLNHEELQIRKFGQELMKSGNTEAAEVAESLVREIDDYQPMCKELGLSTEYACSLFILAHVGSCCRRGFQYSAAFSEREGLGKVLYASHHLRADFLDRCRDFGVEESSDPDRMYWWSWGCLLAKAIEQRPLVWSLDRISKTLLYLKKRAKSESLSISSEDTSVEVMKEAHAMNLPSLIDAARSSEIVLRDSEKANPLQKWITVIARNMPGVVTGSAVALLEQITGLSGLSAVLIGGGTQISLDKYYPEWSQKNVPLAIEYFNELWLRMFSDTTGSAVRVALDGRWRFNSALRNA